MVRRVTVCQTTTGRRRSVGRARRHTEITRTPRDAGDQLTLVVKRYDNKLWEVNGEPCDSPLIAARVVLECLETLDRRSATAASA